MENNLFINLFKYRPRPNRNPLEDYATECLAYLLQKDSELLKRYLNIFWNVEETRKRIKVKTQLTVPLVGRIDMAIFWEMKGIEHSLFIEHKVGSLPWEHEGDDNFESQIDTYCDYQNSANKSTICNRVVLVSRFPISGYSKLEKKMPSYCGNYTWNEITKMLKSYCKTNPEKNVNELARDFINFMRRYQMSGLENFKISELSSITSYNSYEKKRAQLNSSILEAFNVYERNLKKYRVKLSPGWGANNIGNHWGAIFFKEDDNHAAESGFWILIGFSSKSPESESWYPPILCSDDDIPDIECMVMMEFKTSQNRKQFIDDISKFNFDSWNKEKNHEFCIFTPDSTTFSIIKRKSLSSFLSESDQELLIINYLKKGLEAILEENSPLNKIIDAYLALQ